MTQRAQRRNGSGAGILAGVSRRSRWLVLLGLLLLVGVSLLAGSRTSVGDPAPPIPAAPVVAAGPPAQPAPARGLPPTGPSVRTPTPAPAPSAPVTAPAPPPVIDEGYPVKLDRLRAEIPRNRYWVDLAPTDDPDVLRRRETEAAGWNQLYGRVLSGTANEVEIRSWIDHRRQVSEDAIDFAQRVLAEHGAELPDRDRGLLELAIDMHRTRLAELPRQESEARARKAEQDRRRAAWTGTTTP